jgi:hypothetical protein
MVYFKKPANNMNLKTLSTAITAITAVTLFSCSPKLSVMGGVKTETENVTREVYVFGKNEIVPENTSFLGKVETKGNFFTSGKFKVNESIELIKKGALQLNGNAVKIEEIRSPGPFKSKSYDITAMVLQIEKNPVQSFRVVPGTNNKDSEYLKLYRPKRVFGSGISYPVYINNAFVCGLDNGKKITIELENGAEESFLQIESYGKLYKVPLIFKNDSVIFVECTVSSDGSPKVRIPDSDAGEKEYSEIKNTP